MLRANVGLSRKLSRDYNSSGFTINLEAEITASPQDTEAVIEQVKELYDLAEEALDVQVDRSQADSNIAHREAREVEPTASPRPESAPGNGRRTSGNGDEPATDKQISYLLSIGKRQRYSTLQLERKICSVLDKQVGLYDLSKREAARAIDALTGAATNGSRN